MRVLSADAVSCIIIYAFTLAKCFLCYVVAYIVEMYIT